MNYKALALGAVIGFGIAIFPSCGPAKCSPANCKGCCNTGGKCIDPGTNTDCGSQGVACKACQGTEVCTAGICQTGGGNGGGGGGQGGGGGAACSPACSTNTKCVNGTCVCDATTCTNGCCISSGTTVLCAPGTTQTNCGKGGAACASCNTAGNETCVNQVCTNTTPDAGQCPDKAGITGTACSSNADCQCGLECRMVTQTNAANTYSGGYCTRRCGTGSDGGTCASDAVCVSFNPQLGEPGALCSPRCTPPQSIASTCRTPGYACYGLQGTTAYGICWIYPANQGDAGPPSDKVGNPCTMDSDCRPAPDNGICFSGTLPDGGPSGYLNGYCTNECPNPGCGDGGICITFGTPPNDFDICQAKCSPPGQQGGCRTGYICLGYNIIGADGGVQPSPDGICRPNCNNPGWGCPTGQTCQASGFCQ